MAYLNPLVLDNGLAFLSANADRLDVCYAEPTTFGLATTGFTLGNKSPLILPAPSNLVSPAGRRVLVPQITDGVVTATSTGEANDAEFWAISDTVNGRLLAVGVLASAQLLVIGDGFTLTSFSIGLPFPV